VGFLAQTCLPAFALLLRSKAGWQVWIRGTELSVTKKLVAGHNLSRFFIRETLPVTNALLTVRCSFLLII
jgi:hypothetical protein